MNQKEMLTRLTSIEEALTAKGHPMQDCSTVKMAMADLITIVREVLLAHPTQNEK